MSVGLVTVAYGAKYQAFLLTWAQAVSRLNTPPEQIIIVGDDIDMGILNTVDGLLYGVEYLHSTTVPEHHPQILVNEAIARLSTKWVCKIDVDDWIKPTALDEQPWPGDIRMFGIELNGQPMPAQQVTASDVLGSPHNLVFSGSAFRKWVWEAAPYRDMIYEDWAFWIEAAKNGAQFTQSGQIDYEYRLHGANISMHCNDPYWRQKVNELR